MKFNVFAAAALFAALTSCATVSLNQAPITERSGPNPGSAAAVSSTGGATAAPVTDLSTPPPPTGASSYVVKAGDTLYSIALAFGHDYRELARWNGLDDPTRLKIGQTLRVQPPASGTATAAGATPATGDDTAGGATAVAVPLGIPAPPASPTSGMPATPAAPAAALTPAPTPAPTPATAAPAAAAAATQTPPPTTLAPPTPLDTGWVWPATGSVIARFDDPRNKGIDIEGKEGDPVLAANDGTVVYSGSGLRGYGNLVIIKHTDDFISAYAHNREIVVGQGQAVKRGQRIAVLGKSEAESPRLHFEIRRQGKPVDPTRYLPSR